MAQAVHGSGFGLRWQAMMRSHFTRSHVAGCRFVVKQDEAFDPRDIRLLGTVGQMPHTTRIRHLDQKSGFPWLIRSQATRAEGPGAEVDTAA